MPDGKKRPRKVNWVQSVRSLQSKSHWRPVSSFVFEIQRSRKSKGANNPGNEAQNGLEIEDQNGAIENVEDQPENTAEDQASTSQLPSVPAPQSQTSLSKSYPRPNNPSNSYSKPNPPPRPVPQQAPPVHSGPKVSFHERTNPHKPSVIPNFEKEGEAQRGYTLSVAIPGSIVRNAQTPELQSRLAGHVSSILSLPILFLPCLFAFIFQNRNKTLKISKFSFKKPEVLFLEVSKAYTSLFFLSFKHRSVEPVQSST